jgi:hypothetical protein
MRGIGILLRKREGIQWATIYGKQAVAIRRYYPPALLQRATGGRLNPMLFFPL